MDNFLSSTADYPDAKQAAEFSAFALYGLCSNEREQTINAWAAVGMGQPITPLTISGLDYLFYSNTSPLYVPIDYVASGGRQNVRYKWDYAGSWSYSLMPYMGDRNTFRITNFNNDYNTTTVSVNDDCHTADMTIKFVDLDNAIEINPNPAENILNVNVKLPVINSNNPIRVSIFDLYGTFLYDSYETTNSFQIDVSGYPFGNYFLKVTQEDIKLSKQFLKN